MKKQQGYIAYFEGLNAEGFCVINGNDAVNVEYDEDAVCAVQMLKYCSERLLTDVKEDNPNVTRILIKNICKL